MNDKNEVLIQVQDLKKAFGKLEVLRGISTEIKKGEVVVLGIRPEHVHDEPEEIAKAECLLKANVDVTELMGAEIYLYVNINGTPITARVEPTSTAKPGDDIEIAFDLSKLHIFDKDTEKTITN